MVFVCRSGALVYGSYNGRFAFATNRRRFCTRGNFRGRPREYGRYETTGGTSTETNEIVRSTIYTDYNTTYGIPFRPDNSHPICYDRYFRGVGGRN